MILHCFLFISDEFLETLSSEDHCFRDDPGYKNLVQDPKSIKVLPANQEDYDNHLYNRNVGTIPHRYHKTIFFLLAW